MSPKISIITASYNYGNYIKEAIESVIAQTYSDWEMIIVDDGSKDNSLDVINEYVKKDDRIKVFTHPEGKNCGLVKTLQLGLQQAQGEYIVFLEADDYITADYLEKKIGIFEKNDSIGLVYNNIHFVGCEKYFCKKSLRDINNYWKKHNYAHNLSDIFHIKQFILTFSCVMVRKDVLLSCDFNSPRDAHIDYWLWSQISAKTNFYYLQDKLTFWRRHDVSYIRNEEIDINKMQDYYKQVYGLMLPIKNPYYKILFWYKIFKQNCKLKKNIFVQNHGRKNKCPKVAVFH